MATGTHPGVDGLLPKGKTVKIPLPRCVYNVGNEKTKPTT